MKIHSRYIALVLLQLISGIVACGTPEPVLVPTVVFPTNTPDTSSSLSRNPFETTPCSPPCWNNIIPGKTTLDEAKVILFDEMGLQKDCTVDVAEDASLILCGSSVGIWFDESGHVTWINLQPDGTVLLGQVVNTMGEPSEVSFCRAEDSSSGIAILTYIPDKLLFYVDGPYEIMPSLQPNMVIRKMLYGVTDQGQRGWSYDCYRVISWHGFTDYSNIEE
jgi:hypothetical protein